MVTETMTTVDTEAKKDQKEITSAALGPHGDAPLIAEKAEAEEVKAEAMDVTPVVTVASEPMDVTPVTTAAPEPMELKLDAVVEKSAVSETSLGQSQPNLADMTGLFIISIGCLLGNCLLNRCIHLLHFLILETTKDLIYGLKYLCLVECLYMAVTLLYR